MKILKIIFLTLFVVIGLLLVGGLFLKKEYNVSREVTINKPRQQVFNYIKYLKNQDKFSKWANMDRAMKKSYRGVDGTVGFVSAWESKSKDVGVGEQEIKNIVDDERIDYELRFMEPIKSTSDASMLVNDAELNATKVTWKFHGKMNYPLNIVMLFVNFEKAIGDDLQVGLTNLKSIMERG